MQNAAPGRSGVGGWALADLSAFLAGNAVEAGFGACYAARMIKVVLALLLLTGAAEAACRGGYATSNGCVPFDRTDNDQAIADHQRWMDDRRRDDRQEQASRDLNERLDRIERRQRP